jgi:hypothetical protein
MDFAGQSMDTALKTGVQTCMGFVAFLSKTYGTGSTVADVGILGALFLLGYLLLTWLNFIGLSRPANQADLTSLDDIAEYLNRLNGHVSEMQTLIIQEFHRCRGELGAVRQDLIDVKTAILERPVSQARTEAEQRRTKVPTFYGGRAGDLSNLR